MYSVYYKYNYICYNVLHFTLNNYICFYICFNIYVIAIAHFIYTEYIYIYIYIFNLFIINLKYYIGTSHIYFNYIIQLIVLIKVTNLI